MSPPTVTRSSPLLTASLRMRRNTGLSFHVSAVATNDQSADCGLRIADCGFCSVGADALLSSAGGRAGGEGRRVGGGGGAIGARRGGAGGGGVSSHPLTRRSSKNAAMQTIDDGR